MNKRDNTITLPIDNNGNSIIITNLRNIARGGDYDDAEVFAYLNKKRYFLCKDGFAFGIGAQLFEEWRPLETDTPDLHVKNVGDKCKVILTADNSFFTTTLFEGEKYGFLYYKCNGSVHLRFVRTKYNFRGKNATCKLKLLYKTILTPNIIKIWENVRKTEYLPRLEIERYFIMNQGAALREKYSRLEDVDIPNTIDDIIAKYCIQQVGIRYADMIVSRDNFVDAVNDFHQLGYRVVEVCWWQHSKIGEVLDNFSMGGPIDKQDEQYFWGETNLSKNFENYNWTENAEQVLKYFADFIKTDKHNLFPAITLAIF